MTNVPNNLREMWADVYRLFDMNYNMKNDEESWKKFWDQATQIVEKYKHDCGYINSMISLVAYMIEEPMKKQMGVINPCELEDMKLF